MAFLLKERPASQLLQEGLRYRRKSAWGGGTRCRNAGMRSMLTMRIVSFVSFHSCTATKFWIKQAVKSFMGLQRNVPLASPAISTILAAMVKGYDRAAGVCFLFFYISLFFSLTVYNPPSVNQPTGVADASGEASSSSGFIGAGVIGAAGAATVIPGTVIPVRPPAVSHVVSNFFSCSSLSSSQVYFVNAVERPSNVRKVYQAT